MVSAGSATPTVSHPVAVRWNKTKQLSFRRLRQDELEVALVEKTSESM